MKPVLTKFYLFAASLLISTLVLSACTLPEQPNVVMEPEVVTEPEVAEAPGTGAAVAGVSGAQDVLVTATSLLDLSFENLAGEDIGEIENFVVNMETGQIPYATIEYGGFLDIGDTEVAVPLSAFNWTPTGELALAVPTETFDNYPQLAAGWDNFADPAWDDQLVEFWQGAGFEPMAFDAAADHLVWASDAVGYGVGDIGFGVGEVNNMLVDLEQGRADFVVLAYEPGLFENELIAAPFSAFAWQGVGNDLAFAEGITQETLVAAPTFAAADLAAGILDPAWDDNFFTYWEDAGYAVLPGVAANQAVVEPAQEAVTPPEASMGIFGAENVYVLGTTLLDYDFESIDGGTSGEIEDVIIDSNNGQILFVTVEYGGFLEIGDTELPMPLSAFGVGPDGRLVLRFRDEVLESFPDLGTDWGDFTNPAWEDDVVAFWRNAGFEPGFDITEATTGIVRASTMIGYPVADIGYGVSSVQNMVVNLGQGMAPYVLVDYDSFGVGDELVAVPFTAFDPTLYGSEFVFDADWDPALLESAPVIDPVALGAEPFDPTLLEDWTAYWEDRGIQVTETE